MTTRMITCCPACSTLFKVDPDQLQIAGGWVRCGQCMAVFDARARMVSADPYVPPDLDWQEDTESQSDAPSSGAIEGTTKIEPRTAADGPTDIPAANTEAIAPVPEPRREPPAAETPTFAAPAFELVPPSSPEEPVSMPVFIGKPPVRTFDPKGSATDQSQEAIAPTPPLPIPTRDELDRRHAQLLETLARLRENVEKRQRELESAKSSLLNDERSGLPAEGQRNGSRNAQRDALPQDVDRDTHRHSASTDRDPVPERKREGRLPDKDWRTERDSWLFQDQEQPDEEQLSRPMIDFVLSEIDRPLPLPASISSRREANSELKPDKPDVPSFIEQARRRAFWSLPQVRAGLWAAAGVLAMALVAQIAVSQRDRLAAQYPGAIPLLQALCRPMQCQLAPWRHLDAIIIDSSTFVRMGPHGFSFAVTLRNSGAVPVATPALELALIDAQDQPLARRVLNPADWGAPTQLAAYGEFNGAAVLRVQDAANPQAVSNYRLTAFYP